MSNSFVLSGESVTDSKPYLYGACGLDGIYLLNGYTIDERDGEEYVTIKNIDGLHCAIGKHLVTERKALSPQELRFLRNTMDLTQAELASALGKNSQSVARWEKGTSELPAAEEKLLRILFLVHCMDEEEVSELVDFLKVQLEQLDSVDEIGTRPVQFCLNEHWRQKAEAA